MPHKLNTDDDRHTDPDYQNNGMDKTALKLAVNHKPEQLVVQNSAVEDMVSKRRGGYSSILSFNDNKLSKLNPHHNKRRGSLLLVRRKSKL